MGLERTAEKKHHLYCQTDEFCFCSIRHTVPGMDIKGRISHNQIKTNPVAALQQHHYMLQTGQLDSAND